MSNVVMPGWFPVRYHADSLADLKDWMIDKTCYPWVAYKGPRFDPLVALDCYTEAESYLIWRLADEQDQ